MAYIAHSQNSELRTLFLSMKRRGLIIIAVVLAAIVTLWITVGKPNVLVATGYTAKYVCSATFLTDFSQENLDNILDLDFVRLVKYDVDQEDKKVTATLFGLAKQTFSYYENGNSCGCVRGEPDFPEQKPLAASQSPAADAVWPQADKLRDSIPGHIDVAKLRTVLETT
ncbi:MAG TPA: hypothetical protein DCE41_20140, partial [Cytophagales bacterium]|nr:hypothetical protein [Cytophagales bacterium]